MKIFKMALEGTFQKINHVTSHRVVDIMMLLQLLNEPIYEDLQDGYFWVSPKHSLIRNQWHFALAEKEWCLNIYFIWVSGLMVI